MTIAEIIGTLTQTLIVGVTTGSIYVLVGIGFSPVHGATGLASFAQGDVTVISAYIGLTLFHLLVAALGSVGIRGVSPLLLFIPIRLLQR